MDHKSKRIQQNYEWPREIGHEAQDSGAYARASENLDNLVDKIQDK